MQAGTRGNEWKALLDDDDGEGKKSDWRWRKGVKGGDGDDNAFVEDRRYGSRYIIVVRLGHDAEVFGAMGRWSDGALERWSHGGLLLDLDGQ